LKYKVLVKPQNEIIEVDGQTNLLEALLEKGFYIKSSCGGVASCSDCIVKIVSGECNLNTPPVKELQFLGNVFHITKERLSCQTRIKGPVTVDISGHDRKKDQEKLKLKSQKSIIRKQKVKEKKEEESTPKSDQSWVKHWEKAPVDKRTKRLGGGRRPKTFKTDDLAKGPTDFRKIRKK
jgi:ferredoxin